MTTTIKKENFVQADELLTNNNAKPVFVKSKPDFVGDGVAVWVKKDRFNVEYLNVKVLGHIVTCFPNRSSD